MISLVSGFLSLILVIPQISDNQELYGIYAYVISLSLYFTYADIGFISAGQKYAAEAFAKTDPEEEAAIFGFTIAVMACMFTPMSVTFFFLHMTPSLAFDNLSEMGTHLTSELFFVLAFLVPLQIILQRTVKMILSVRLLDYVSTRIDIFFNIIKLVSLFYFFKSDNYMLVEYFYFCTLVTILGSIIGLIYVKYKTEFKFSHLIYSIRLTRKYYGKTKDLAFASAALTVSFVLFTELDLVIIAHYFGAKEVALYAVAFTFVGFLRRIWSIVYSPISVRLNHFIGVDSHDHIVELITRVIYYTFPVCLIVTVTLIICADYLVFAWVGAAYESSIIVLQILVLSFFPAYLTNIGFHYFVSHGRQDFLYCLAVVLPLAFYGFVFFLKDDLGPLSLAYGKLLVGIIEIIICWVGLKNIINPGDIIQRWILPSLIWLLAAVVLLPMLMEPFALEFEKSSLRLLEVLVFLAIFVSSSCIAFFTIYKTDRLNIAMLFRNFIAWMQR